MSRPLKSGIDYFPLDVDIFENDKLFDIQNDYGCLGEVIYLRLLCLVYKNGYYYKFESIDKLSAMIIKSIGNKWIGNKQTVTQVIRALVEVDLFSRTLFSSNVITSESIQRRYLKATERRQLMNSEEYWLLDKSNNRVLSDTNNSINVYNNPVNVCNNPINVYKSTQSKVKESKVNKSKEYICKNADTFVADKSDIFIELTLKDNTLFAVTSNKVAEYKGAYPGIDIEAQLKRMKAWCNDNPTKRKTKAGICRFINNWLATTQDKVRSNTQQSPKCDYSELPDWD